MSEPSEFVTDDGRVFKIGYQLAFQGLEGCMSMRCTRTGYHQREDGTWDSGRCIGWHCPVCLEPTSMMGHKCPDRGES